MFSEQQTFEIGGEEQTLRIYECMDSLGQVADLRSKLMKGEFENPLGTISQLLVKVGFFSKNIQMGKQLYLQQNYAAQRVKNTAQKYQASKNVELKKGQIQIVKKNYKGKIEMLKKHQNIAQYHEENAQQQFDENSEVDQTVAHILKKSKDTQLAYLKIQKVENLQYKFGVTKTFTSEFFFLNKT